MAESTTRPAALLAATGKKPPDAKPRKTQEEKDRFLPVVSSDVLEDRFVSFDDYPEDKPLNGYSASTIAQLGYKCPGGGLRDPMKIARKAVVIPVRNAHGKIVGLHGADGKWFTARRIHFSNSKRANWTRQIEIFATTIEADIEALRRNVATVALNGMTYHDLEMETANLQVELVAGWRVAA